MDKLKPGDFFIHCSYHPCLCFNYNEEEDEVEGISLIDGKMVNCSIIYYNHEKISFEKAIEMKVNGPSDEIKEQLEKHFAEWGGEKWW
jgi:hypothetical protein